MRGLLNINPRVLFIGLLLTPLAIGDPITFTFSGIGSGSLGTDLFTNAAFTFTFTSDTSLLTITPCCANDTSTPKGTPATFAISGVGSGSLTGDQAVFVNPTTDDVGIWVFGPPDFLTLGNFAFSTYDLSTDIGPISGTPSALSEFLPTSINHELLSMTAVSQLAFTADVEPSSPVPEPSSFAMLGLSLGCLLILNARRRLLGNPLE